MTPRSRPALPVLDDPARSPDPAVCPFLRQEVAGSLLAPASVPSADQTCVAIGAPRPQSLRQQELVCLHEAHADCPRYVRGAMALASASGRTVPTVPRATLAALLILVLSAGISFGFVVQRGGIEMPAVGARPTSVAMEPSPVPRATVPGVVAATASPAVAVSPSSSPSSSSAVGETTPPTSSPSIIPTSSPRPTARPTAAPTPKPTAKPKSNRYALLRPCPDRKACFIYAVRSGDNLSSIANWFGVPLKTLYAWNPRYASGARLRAGDPIRMPPPTR